MYLRQPSVIAQVGRYWLFDFMMVVVESMIFVFLATTCSETAARQARVGFVELLLALYIVDIIWVLSMWLRRIPKIPWSWAAVNLTLSVLIWLLGLWTGDFYSPTMLFWLTVTHVVAFIIDVLIYDHLGLLN